MSKRICLLFLSAFAVCLFLSGCVDQHPEKSTEAYTAQGNGQTGAVEAAREKVIDLGRAPRIVATSPAAAQICEKLELNLVGVCSSTAEIPDRYQDLPTIGTAMSPDMEIVSSLNPDWILAPSSLETDLKPKFEELKNTEYAFLNLRSVQGMYRSIQELGEIFGKQQEAEKMTKEFTTFYKRYTKRNKNKKHPKVLVLMGLPGSYIIATENSYVGSLVKLAGGENVYQNTDQEFLTVNTEDMKKKEPDIIVRAAHALPDQVTKMFNEDFETNDIWKHFDAVKNKRVYDLTYEYFGMSANFKYKKALSELEKDFYQDSKDTQEVTK